MQTKNINKKPLIALIVLLGVVAALLIAKNRNGYRYAGTLEATRVDVPARVGSVVAAREINEGQAVKAGTLLYRLACEDLAIAAQTATKDYERADRLFKAGSMPLEAYEHLKSKADDINLKLKWCKVEAPSDGTVLSTYREPGEWVTPGTRLLTLANLAEIWALFYVEQPRVSQLRLEQKIQGIIPEMPGKVFEGQITKINNEAEFTPKNVQTREERIRLVYGVKVQFQNSEGILKPGMTIEAKLGE